MNRVNHTVKSWLVTFASEGQTIGFAGHLGLIKIGTMLNIVERMCTHDKTRERRNEVVSRYKNHKEASNMEKTIERKDSGVTKCVAYRWISIVWFPAKRKSPGTAFTYGH